MHLFLYSFTIQEVFNMGDGIRKCLALAEKTSAEDPSLKPPSTGLPEAPRDRKDSWAMQSLHPNFTASDTHSGIALSLSGIFRMYFSCQPRSHTTQVANDSWD
jgi:hypothetical protein